MKLLFDANLPPKLVGRLAALSPDSIHVFDTGLARFTTDKAIWEYARNNGFVIVTADSDFLGIAEERGAPPKVVRLDNCNYRTPRVEDQQHHVSVSDQQPLLLLFAASPHSERWPPFCPTRGSARGWLGAVG